MVSLNWCIPQSIFATRSHRSHMKQTFCSRQNVFFVFAHLSSFCAPFFPVLIGYTAIHSPPAPLEECGYTIDVLRVSRESATQIMFTAITVRWFCLPPYSWNGPQARFTLYLFSWNRVKSNASISFLAVCAVNGAAAHWHDSYGSILNDTMYNVYSFCQQQKNTRTTRSVWRHYASGL